jgi:hypothetical protein
VKHLGHARRARHRVRAVQSPWRRLSHRRDRRDDEVCSGRLPERGLPPASPLKRERRIKPSSIFSGRSRSGRGRPPHRSHSPVSSRKDLGSCRSPEPPRSTGWKTDVALTTDDLSEINDTAWQLTIECPKPHSA